jgi:hypothetical protein
MYPAGRDKKEVEKERQGNHSLWPKLEVANSPREPPQGTYDIKQEETFMFMYVSFQPVFALVAGVLILIFPRLLNYIIALYLIIIGITGLVR